MAPAEPTTENIQISLRYPQGEETQSRLHSDLTSLENERISNVVGESMNDSEDSGERRIRDKQTRQDPEIRNKYDQELEFPSIEKQL